jgi:hypothetical protein
MLSQIFYFTLMASTHAFLRARWRSLESKRWSCVANHKTEMTNDSRFRIEATSVSQSHLESDQCQQTNSLYGVTSVSHSLNRSDKPQPIPHGE